jgi:hypothetical protein
MTTINTSDHSAAIANRGRVPTSKGKSSIGYSSHLMNAGPVSMP